MIVRCVSEYPDEEQLRLLGPKFFRNRSFGVVVGREYIVFGVTVVIEASSAGKGLLFEHLTDTNYGYLVSTPACLFQIVDGTASSHWRIRIEDDGAVRLWPEVFYKEYFHDRLSDGDPEAVEDFRRIRERIEAEAVGRELSR